MKLFISIPVLLVSLALFAASGMLVLEGDYTHEFTGKKDDPVWSVVKGEKSYSLKTHGDGSVIQVRELTPDERKRFWKKMWWDDASHESAVCAAGEDEIICFVPEKARQQNEHLKLQNSDYFHYDSIGGVIEAEKIKK